MSIKLTYGTSKEMPEEIELPTIELSFYDIQPIMDFVNKENICVNADNQTYGCTEDCTGTERCTECQKEFERCLQIAINENLINNIEELKKRKEQGWKCQ